MTQATTGSVNRVYSIVAIALLSLYTFGNATSQDVHVCSTEEFKDTIFSGFDRVVNVSEPPNMRLLNSFPTVINRELTTISIISRIGLDYPNFGVHILQDDNRVRNYEKQFHFNPVDITREILRDWLNGKGKKPVTWNTLLWALEKTQLMTLVDDIKASCNDTILDVPFQGPVFDATLDYAEELRKKYKKEPIIDQYQKLLASVGVSDKVSFTMSRLESGIPFTEFISHMTAGSRLLLTGRPGVGKSTLTRYAAQKWAEGTLLPDCVLTIRVPLLTTISDLSHLLEKELPDYTDIPMVVHEMKASKGKGICIILDAFDEYTLSETDILLKILKRDILPQSAVIVTSRTNTKLYELQKTNVFNKGDDSEVIGFDSKDVRYYLDQLPAELSQEIRDVFAINPNVEDMCYLPLHMTMIIYLASVDVDKLSTLDTETILYTDFLLLTFEQYESRHGWSAIELEECFQDTNSTDNLCVIFKKIGKLAYNGLFNDNYMFNSTYFNERERKSLEKLSLFGVQIERSRRGYLFHYSFPHRTFQEYLAAFYISTLQRQELLSVFDLHVNRERFLVWKFYFGITGEKGLGNSDPKDVQDIFRKFALDYVGGSNCSFDTYSNKEFNLLIFAFEAGLKQSLHTFVNDTNIITGPHCDNYFLNYPMSNTQHCFYLAYALAWIPVRSLVITIHFFGTLKNCETVFKQQWEAGHQQSMTIEDLHIVDELRKQKVLVPTFLPLLNPTNMKNFTYVCGNEYKSFGSREYESHSRMFSMIKTHSQRLAYEYHIESGVIMNKTIVNSHLSQWLDRQEHLEAVTWIPVRSLVITIHFFGTLKNCETVFKQQWEAGHQQSMTIEDLHIVDELRKQKVLVPTFLPLLNPTNMKNFTYVCGNEYKSFGSREYESHSRMFSMIKTHSQRLAYEYHIESGVIMNKTIVNSHLSQWLDRQEHLEAVTIHCALDESSAENIAKTLTHLRKLTSLTLTLFPQVDADKISEGLRAVPQLRELDITWLHNFNKNETDGVTNDGALALIESIRQLKHLQRLSFDCNYGENCETILPTCLQNLKALKHLTLRSHMIVLNEAQSLAAAFTQLRSLTHLKFDKIYIDSGAESIISKDLKELESLVYRGSCNFEATMEQQLDLWTTLTGKTFGAVDMPDVHEYEIIDNDWNLTEFVSFLPELKHLQHLEISTTCIDYQEAVALSEALANLKSLTSLHVSGNHISKEAFDTLARQIEKMEQLHSLSLYDNNNMVTVDCCYSDQLANFERLTNLTQLTVSQRPTETVTFLNKLQPLIRLTSLTMWETYWNHITKRNALKKLFKILKGLKKIEVCGGSSCTTIDNDNQ